jgi:hypothetical protein
MCPQRIQRAYVLHEFERSFPLMGAAARDDGTARINGFAWFHDARERVGLARDARSSLVRCLGSPLGSPRFAP